MKLEEEAEGAGPVRNGQLVKEGVYGELIQSLCLAKILSTLKPLTLHCALPQFDNGKN
jgi:hypothetical protein